VGAGPPAESLIARAPTKHDYAAWLQVLLFAMRHSGAKRRDPCPGGASPGGAAYRRVAPASCGKRVRCRSVAALGGNTRKNGEWQHVPPCPTVMCGTYRASANRCGMVVVKARVRPLRAERRCEVTAGRATKAQ